MKTAMVNGNGAFLSFGFNRDNEELLLVDGLFHEASRGISDKLERR
jgi:hypothetical protein